MDKVLNNQVDTTPPEKSSISTMAIKLNISRGKLYRLLQQSGQYEAFKASGETQPENNQILYSKQDWETILTDIGYAYPQPEQPTEQPGRTALDSVSKIEIIDSQRDVIIPAPEIPSTIDFAVVRQNLGIPAPVDNSELLTQAHHAVGAIQAMSAHLDSQWAQKEQQLRESQQTAATVRRAVQGLQDKARRIEMKSEIAAEMKALADSETQERLAEVASLGKPAVPSASATES